MTTRYPGAVWKPGPANKVNGGTNPAAGIVMHSMVGFFDSAMRELSGAAQKSWHFSVRQSGEVFQHYELGARCWHAGPTSPLGNQSLIGIEHEGGAPGKESEPLTPAQLAASVALARWIADVPVAWALKRTEPFKTLYEHRELFATACPSNRIPWAAYLAAAAPPAPPPDEPWRDIRTINVGDTRIYEEAAALKRRDAKKLIFDAIRLLEDSEKDSQDAHESVGGDRDLIRGR